MANDTAAEDTSSTQAIDRIVHAAEKELASIIPGGIEQLTSEKEGRIISSVTSGRPKSLGGDFSPASVWSITDATNVFANTPAEDISELCRNARLNHARSVCVRLESVEQAKEELEGSDLKVVAVTNFPEGTLPVSEAVGEMKKAVALGVDEIDTVFPRHLLKQGDMLGCYQYMKQVIDAVSLPVKVILESADLTHEETARAAIIAKAAGAQCVKTSTGFHENGGADVESVRIMRRSVGDDLDVKASGKVRTLEQAMAMVDAGASIIGASNLTVHSRQATLPPELVPDATLPKDQRNTGRGQGY